MPELTTITALQLILAFGLLNVWLVRRDDATPYRGGDAQSLRQEFDVYGLPTWFFALVGALKVGAAVALITSLWFPALLVPTAALVVALMIGALAMHVKVGDPALRSVPALCMLFMSAALCAIELS